MLLETTLAIHRTCATLSVLGLTLRWVISLRASPAALPRWARVAPHVNDTLLLAAGVVLMVLTGQHPPQQVWLTAKLLALVLYIGLGVVALKTSLSRNVRIPAGVAALLVFGYIVSVAVTRNPLGFVARL